MATLPKKDAVIGLSVSARQADQSHLLAAKSRDGTVSLWRISREGEASLTRLAATLAEKGPTNFWSHLAFHPTDPNLLVTLSDDAGSVRAWHLNSALLKPASSAPMPDPDFRGPEVRSLSPDEEEIRSVPTRTLSLAVDPLVSFNPEESRLDAEMPRSEVTDPVLPNPQTPATSLPTIQETSPSSPPLVLIYVTEQRESDLFSLKYWVQAPTLNRVEYFESSPLRESQQTLVNDLSQRLAQIQRRAQLDNQAFHAELESFGASLFHELFPYAMQHFLWENRASLNDIRCTTRCAQPK